MRGVGGVCGISLLGLSGEDSSPPHGPLPAALSLQPKGGHHPPTHPSPEVGLNRQLGHPSPPHSLPPKSPAFWPRRATETRGGTKHKDVLLSDGSGAEGQTEEAGRPHTRYVSSPLSSSSSSKSLSLVCLFVLCLESSQSKKGGRVQGVGRLVTAAGALGAGERGDLRAGEDKRGSVRRVNNGEGVAEDLNFTVCKERSCQVGVCVLAGLEGQGRWWRGRQQPAETIFLSGC